MTGDPLTFGWERNFIAFCTCSSRIGSEFTNTEVGELSFTASTFVSGLPPLDGSTETAVKILKYQN